MGMHLNHGFNVFEVLRSADGRAALVVLWQGLKQLICLFKQLPVQSDSVHR
ncbi:hypothetical protein AGR5A_pb0112 [Agrobacterium genomosp. 5 str. CFBP 6626]|nr:hypothetical protein AGR5A_pb0112 [Agrobacterium genomosp. 5 str. CFBP 6626]